MAGSGGPPDQKDPVDAARGFLSRWSRRKLERQGEEGAAAAAVAPAASVEPAAQGGIASPAAPSPAETAPELPPIESLTSTSDFSAFMHPAVAPALRRAALKKLFADPHFNVMDGLDTYVDDYSIEDPIPEELMKKLYQARQHVFSSEQNAALDADDEAARTAAAAAGDAQAEASTPADAAANAANEVNQEQGKA